MKLITIPVGTLGTNCYIAASQGNKCAVIDPGAQNEKIIRTIEENSLTPTVILLTHGHHDHIGAVKKLLDRYTDISVYIGAEDMEMLGDTQKSLAAFRNQDASDFVVKSAKPVADGETITVDELEFRAITTPGHTKGGIVYLCGDCMFSGDTLFRDDVGRCDLYGGSYPVMKRSLQKLVALDGDYLVYPGHGESSTLEYERRNNQYINEPMPV